MEDLVPLQILHKEFIAAGLMAGFTEGYGHQTLKVQRVTSRNSNSFLSCTPEKYVLIIVETGSSLSATIYVYTYNEERKLDRYRKYPLFDPDVPDIKNQENIQVIVDHILQELNSNDKVCQGIQKEELVVQDINKILVEKYGTKIIYRSRNCDRLIENKDDNMKNNSDICNKCTSILQPILKMEQEEILPQEGVTAFLRPNLYLEENIRIENKAKRKKQIEKCGKKSSKTCRIKKPLSKNLHSNKNMTSLFGCETCNKSYSSHRYLSMHRCKQSVDPEPIICHKQDCGKIFKTKSSLTDHLNSVHSNEKQFMCSGCGKAYRNRQKRRTCENFHMEKFNHPCSLCDKKFNCKRRYLQHMRTHTGEKPFCCPVCSYRCSRLDNLNIHSKKSHGMSVIEAEIETGISAKQDKIIVQTNTENLSIQQQNLSNLQFTEASFAPSHSNVEDSSALIQAKREEDCTNNVLEIKTTKTLEGRFFQENVFSITGPTLSTNHELCSIMEQASKLEQSSNIKQYSNMEKSSNIEQSVADSQQALPVGFITFIPQQNSVHIQKIDQ